MSPKNTRDKIVDAAIVIKRGKKGTSNKLSKPDYASAARTKLQNMQKK